MPKKLNPSTMERANRTGATTREIQIEIENEDLHLLQWIAEKIAEQNRGLIRNLTVSDLIHKAVKNYIIEEVLAALPKQPGGKATYARPEKFTLSWPPQAPANGRGVSASRIEFRKRKNMRCSL